MVVSPGFEGRGVGPLLGSDSNVRTCVETERMRKVGEREKGEERGFRV